MRVSISVTNYSWPQGDPLGSHLAELGRAWLGVGAGYHTAEAAATGLPIPPVTERFERLEETLRIATKAWAGDDSPFDATYYRLGDPRFHPRPGRRPPILIGGTGPRRTLRLVAQYADACNVFDIPDGGATVRRDLATLARHCDEVGRPYDSIEKTMGTRLVDGQSADDFTRHAAAAAEWGIEHLVVLTTNPWTTDRLAPLAAAIPVLANA